MKNLHKKINAAMTEHFGLNLTDHVINFEVISSKNSDNYHGIRAIYEENLKTHPNREIISKKMYISDEFILFIHGSFPKSEVSSIKPDSVLYYPVCTISEILRIESPSCGEDYLLKVQADAIADSPRLVRVFLKRREKDIQSWSLSSYFSPEDFLIYLDHLSEDKVERCRNISVGYAPLREPNGACINTIFGNVIVLSEALKYFLFYMNLFLMGKEAGLDPEDISSSLVIASRTMLLTETLDFDIDPRGELPKEIEDACWAITEDQIQFVIGHEYAHSLLGHVSESNQKNIDNHQYLNLIDNDSKFYSPKQSDEFDADVASILNADYSDNKCARILNASSLFFIHLYIFQSISDYINPSRQGQKSHPPPIDRLWQLRHKVFEARHIESEELYTNSELNDWIEYANQVKESLIKDFLPFNIEALETYGSVYLPSYKKNFLHDRFDF